MFIYLVHINWHQFLHLKLHYLSSVFSWSNNWIYKYFDWCKIIFFFCAEKLNLRAVSEYKYLVQSDCMSIDGVDDAKNFDQLMVYDLTVGLVYNKTL